jgi:hypothetical protein
MSKKSKNTRKAIAESDPRYGFELLASEVVVEIDLAMIAETRDEAAASRARLKEWQRARQIARVDADAAQQFIMNCWGTYVWLYERRGTECDAHLWLMIYEPQFVEDNASI